MPVLAGYERLLRVKWAILRKNSARNAQFAHENDACRALHDVVRPAMRWYARNKLYTVL